MGNKNASKPEKKKPAKSQPKASPGRRREDFNQVASRIVKEPTEK
jgi:hypothetical protein